jgi:hypothetical protein
MSATSIREKYLPSCLSASALILMLIPMQVHAQRADNPPVGVVYRDDDMYAADDFVVLQSPDDWDYGWYYDERLKKWEYGWHARRDFYDDSLDRSDRTSFYWNRDFGWYFDPLTNQWSYGFHLDEDLGAERERYAPSRQIEGEIEGLFTEDIAGQRTLIVAVDTDAGRRVHVHLGPPDQYQNVHFREGDRIRLSGDFDPQNPDMYLATYVFLPNISMAVRRTEPTQVRLTRDSTGRLEIERLSGEVIETFAVNIGGKKHLFLDVKDETGKTVRADLGASELYGSASFDPGEAVTILGRKDDWRGRPIIQAEHVRIGSVSLSVPRQRELMAVDSRVTGTIRNLYKQEISNEEHHIAQVETNAGRLIVVDLGPTWKFDDTLREGDELSLVGRWREFPDGNMLIAERVSVAGSFGRKGGVVVADRAETPQEIAGTIQAIELVNILGKSHTFATIDTADGRSVRVDLGPQTRVDTLNLVPGDRVSFTTRGTSHAREQALVAERLDKIGDRRGQRTPQPQADSTMGVHVDGRVTAVRREMLPGYRQEHLVATIELDDGTTKRVILGEHDRLRDAYIETGDRVSVIIRQDASDPKLWLAQELRLNGRLLFSDR